MTKTDIWNIIRRIIGILYLFMIITIMIIIIVGYINLHIY